MEKQILQNIREISLTNEIILVERILSLIEEQLSTLNEILGWNISKNQKRELMLKITENETILRNFSTKLEMLNQKLENL